MKLEGKAYEHAGMRNADRLMRKYFGDNIQLVEYFGPVQMCVFRMEYEYLPLNYIIEIECERGVITICVENQDGESFYPPSLYSWARRYHYEDVEADVDELVRLAYESIIKGKVQFKL